MSDRNEILAKIYLNCEKNENQYTSQEVTQEVVSPSLTYLS